MNKLAFLSVLSISVVSIAAEPVVTPVHLTDEQYVKAEAIENQNVYHVSTTIGGEVEIKLGEDVSKKEIWQVVSYDPALCRIEVEHEQKGFWPFTREYAEIEFKGVTRGQTDIVLQCGTKRITVRLTVI